MASRPLPFHAPSSAGSNPRPSATARPSGIERAETNLRLANAGDATESRASAVGRFLAGGLATYAINLSLTWLLVTALSVPKVLAYALTLASVLLVGVSLARYWIFRARSESLAKQGITFLVASAGFRALDWALFSTLILAFDPVLPVAILTANVLVLPAKYWLFRNAVFAVSGTSREDSAAGGSPR